MYYILYYIHIYVGSVFKIKLIFNYNNFKYPFIIQMKRNNKLYENVIYVL